MSRAARVKVVLCVDLRRVLHSYGLHSVVQAVVTSSSEGTQSAVFREALSKPVVAVHELSIC